MYCKIALKIGILVSLMLSSGILIGCGSKKKNQSGSVAPVPSPSPVVAPSEAPKNTGGLTDDHATDDSWEPWEKERWLEKAASVLRNGRGIGESDDHTALMALSTNDAVRSFMSDSAFVDTILDFNLFFLGFKNDSQSGGGQSPIVGLDAAIDFPHAISAAREVQASGNFLKLLQLEQPLYLRPLRSASLPNNDDNDDGSDDDSSSPGDPNAPQPTQKEIRQTNYATIITLLDGQIQAISGDQATTQDLCKALDDFPFADLFSNIGVSNDLSNQLSNEWTLGPALSCFFQLEVDLPSYRLSLIRARETMPALFNLIESLDPTLYKPESLQELKPFYGENYGLKPSTQLTDTGFWFNLQNSSTNFNRRRASYVLKRYFCDDLTPISVVAPDQHVNSQHASAPACRSCHYKLDPMAGFFKEIGISGISFKTADRLLFDDGAQIDREKYQGAWKASEGSGRTWEIGYIRSTESQSLNSWGESVQDLFKIIETSPEVKRCIVRRLTDYFVGKDQAVDAGYIDHLTQRFIEESKTNSTEALKNTIASLVTSKTFRTPDPVSNACYDYAPGTDASKRPPCHVAFVLERNCGSCHSSKSSAGGLDLTGWIRLEDGKLAFPHRRGGKQLSQSDSFASIQERLTIMDKAKRMPLDMHMSAADREALFVWVEKTLNH